MVNHIQVAVSLLPVHLSSHTTERPGSWRNSTSSRQLTNQPPAPAAGRRSTQRTQAASCGQLIEPPPSISQKQLQAAQSLQPTHQFTTHTRSTGADCCNAWHLQLEAWEAYARKLEEQVQDLVTHNEAMQRELTEVHSLLDDGTDPEVHGECCSARLQRLSGGSSGWLAD